MTAVANLTELESVHSELERLHERCEKGLLLQAEIGSLLVDLDRRARLALPEATDLFRLYDSRIRGRTEYWEMTIGGYVSPRDCPNIGRRIAALRLVLKEIEPEFLRAEQTPKAQIYFTAGEVYRARQEFYRILTRASTRLDIADPHLDPDVFDFVDSLQDSLTVRLVTGNPKPLFIKQLQALKVSHPSIAARSYDQHHDRFVILDGATAWHLGASINGLGKKAFMMNAVVKEEERLKVVADFEVWWNAGRVL